MEINSVYIHIPFCNSICSYCDFCKQFYNEQLADDYLQSLQEEIINNYQGNLIKTIYIGGGTPSVLNVDQIQKLLEITKVFNLDNNYEFTFECNIESLTKQKLLLLYKNNVNRLSIGVETMNEKFLLFLGRHHKKKEVIQKINLAKSIGFNNISIDLIYALPQETIIDLTKDLEEFLKLGINHVSIYSLIIEEHTKLYLDGVKNINQDDDYLMYKYINKCLKDNGFVHYEISNYARKGYESKHNLCYWNNDYYYGFGLGASGYYNNARYTNTKSMNNYLKGKAIYIKEELSENDDCFNYLMLGLRKINGIHKKTFKKRYNINLNSNKSIQELLSKGLLKENKNYIYIPLKYIYVSNEILKELVIDM